MPAGTSGRSASKIAWWKLWSKRSPFGSIRFNPCRSNAASSSRSVAATPSRRLCARGSLDLGLGHRVERPAQIVDRRQQILRESARARISAHRRARAAGGGAHSRSRPARAAAGPWSRQARPRSRQAGPRPRPQYPRRAARPRRPRRPATSSFGRPRRAAGRFVLFLDHNLSILGYPMIRPITLAV